jgi:hypothetical protein
MPKTAGPVQIEETRRAFYAGSYITLMSIATGIEEDTPDDEGVVMLERLKAECETFLANVKNPEPAPVEPPDIHYTVPDPLDIQAKLKELGATIGEDLPDGWGFNLLLFSYGEGGSLFYISSAARRRAQRDARVYPPADAMSLRRRLRAGLEPFVLVGTGRSSSC